MPIKNLFLILVVVSLRSTIAMACLFPCGVTDCFQYGVFDIKDNCQVAPMYIEAGNWTETNIRYIASEYLASLLTGNVTSASKFGFGDGYDEYASTEAEEVVKLKDSRFKDAQSLFHSGMFVEAAKEFRKLKKESDLRAKTSYLEARSYLHAAQKEFSGYFPPGDVARNYSTTDSLAPTEIAGVDFALLKKSREIFEKYLEEFPKDDWAKSARNLVGRRINLLEGKSQAYTRFIREEIDRELTRITDDPDTQVKNTYILLSEFDRFGHYFSEENLHPLLWIIRANYISRKYLKEGLWTQHPAEKELAILRAEKHVFKKFPELFGLAEAQLLYASGKYKEGLASFPMDILMKDKRLTLSWVMLRANLLLANGQTEEARSYVREFISGDTNRPVDDLTDAKSTVKRWITFSYFWTHEPVKIWQPESAPNWAFIDDTIAGGLIGQSPDLAPVIKQMATKGFPKDIPPDLQNSLSTGLLVKFALELNSEDFLAIWKNAKLRDWQTIATNFSLLQKNPQDAEARFKIISGVETQGHQIVEGMTCEQGHVSKTKIQSPLDHYVEIMSELEKKPNPKLLAEVLAASIKCYKISSRYTCLASSKNEIPPEVRKQWFKTLKKKFSRSEAAQNTTYWW